VNIPFEISISGGYFNNNSARNFITKPTSSMLSLSYKSLRLTGTREYLNYLEKNYYAYYNKNVLFRDTPDDYFTILNYNVDSLNVTNQSSKLLADFNNNVAQNRLLVFTDNSSNIRVGDGNKDLTNIRVEQLFDTSYITIYFTTTYKTISNDQSSVKDVSGSLKLNNYFFELSFNSISEPSDNLIISANFKPNLFFSNSDLSLIDISYIGNYELGITTKGLSGGDCFL
jgi:hypothetical protein